MAVDAAVDHEGGADDGGIAAAAREVARQQRDLEGARSLEDRHLPGRAFAGRGNPRQLALETRLAPVDDIAVPARLHEGDAPGVEKLVGNAGTAVAHARSEEHTSELQSLMRISYAVFCLKKKK